MIIEELEQKAKDIKWVIDLAIEADNQEDLIELKARFLEVTISIQLLKFHRNKGHQIDLIFLKKHF